MRITKLSIKKYKNLEDFEWKLNPDYPVAVIVGKNGSGKTNLLEAIITIFQDLQLYNHENKAKFLPDLKFEIEYLNLDEEIINIKNDGALKITKTYNKPDLFDENEDKVKEQLKIGNEKVIKQLEQIERLRKANEKDLPKVEIDKIVIEDVPLSQLQNFRQTFQADNILPKNIFVYYAGNTTRLKDLTDESISAYKQRLIDIANNKIGSQSSPRQPLFYYDLPHHRAVFLTLMLSSLEDIQKDFLKNDLGIENLVKVELEISRPDWKRSSPDWKKISTDTGSFWDAPNFLQKILDTFRETAQLEIGKDSIINFELLGDEFRRKFTETSNDERDFFQQLSNLILADYLTDIKIYFTKDGVDKILEFNDLSEGEWQRIGIRGAMELFQGEETLFLLDEPDTFAHPRWQWEFVPDIEKNVGKDNKSMQVVFITHSPLVLSSLKDNVFMMEKGKNIKPIHEAYGESLEIVLAKMNGNSNDVEKDFELYFKLIEEGKADTDEAKAERERLEKEYGVSHSEIARAEMWISFYK